MSTFLSILLFNISLFSLMKYIRIYEQGQQSYVILELFINQYEIMFGENPDIDDLKHSRIYFFNYFGFTLIVNIVSLNLLIAVISNTFDCVQSSIEAHHLRTKAQILHELSGFQTWDRNKSERMYLHIIQNANSKLEDLRNDRSDDDDDFIGRVRIISNKI